MKKKKKIGIVIGNINTDFTNELVSGAKKCANDLGVDFTTIILEPLTDNNNELDIFYDYYQYMDLDALVIMYASIYGAQKNPDRFFKTFKDLPLVYIQTEYENTKSINSNVIVDNKSALKKCVDHLIEVHNCKKICFVSGPNNNYDSELRKQAYIESIREHDLDLSDKMIVQGNFSDNIDLIMGELLNNNKNIDGIVFANDTMALASYSILEEHGYKIGKDIAITGFDDVHSANYSHPGLTTISQDTFGLGYEAFKEAFNLIKTKKRKVVKLDTELVIRESCGCKYIENSEEHIINDNIKQMVDSIAENILKYDFEVYLKNKRVFYQLSTNIISALDNKYDFALTKDLLKGIIANSTESLQYVTSFLFELFNGIRLMYPDNSDMFLSILLDVENWLFNYSLEIMSEDREDSEKNIIKSTFLLRKAFETDVTRNSIIQLALEQFMELDINYSYIYLYNSGFKMNGNANHILPENVLLAGYYDNNISFNEDLIGNRYNFKNNKIFIDNESKLSIILSAENKVYGFIICDDCFDKLESIKSLCVQLSTLLYFSEIKKEDMRVREELEQSYLLIERKNEILNNISKVDELTAIYNRRGFIELSQNYIKKYDKKNLELLFIDLDHLKEINDKFGHGEGDFAIKKVAEALEQCLPEDSVIGRIGGDEFVALYYTKSIGDSYYKKLKKYFATFNSSSDKVYYVEASIGRIDFEAYDKIDFTNLLSSADKILYEDKKKRRETIVK